MLWITRDPRRHFPRRRSDKLVQSKARLETKMGWVSDFASGEVAGQLLFATETGPKTYRFVAKRAPPTAANA